MSGMRTIPLTKGKKAIIDDEDYDEISQHKWCFCGGYAVRGIIGRNKLISMHRQIMRRQLKAAGSGHEIDHRNHDGLDNRRRNLRVCTRGQNTHNRKNVIRRGGTSRFKGVCKHTLTGYWRATIKIGDKQIHLGFYNSEVDAAYVYDNAAREYFGEFACTNFTEIRKVARRKYENLPKSKYADVSACFGKGKNFGRIRWRVGSRYFDSEKAAAVAANRSRTNRRARC